MAKRPGIKYKDSNGIGSPEQRTKGQMLPRLLPLKDAATYMGLTVWAIRERVWNGDLPVVQFPNGRKQFIDTQDIEDFIMKSKRILK